MARLKKQDRKKEAEGIWVNWEDGIQLKIARAGNPVFTKMSEEFGARNRALKEEGNTEVPIDVLELEILCCATLVDWRNVDDESGRPLVYTSDEGRRILKDEAYSDLKTFIQQQAIRRSNFIEKGEVETEKNSVPPSSPT